MSKVLDKCKPTVLLTPETMLLLKEIALLTGIEGEVAAFAAALAILRKALGGEPHFHEEEVQNLVFVADFWRNLAALLHEGRIEARYEGKTLQFRAKRNN